MKVWMLTHGCYSDYAVVGLFSTKARALAYQKGKTAVNGGYYDFNDLEVFEIDHLTKARKYTLHYAAIMLDNGEVLERESSALQVRFDIPESHHYICENVPIYDFRSVARAQSCKSAKHAMKLAVEARQEWMRKNAQKLINRGHK